MPSSPALSSSDRTHPVASSPGARDLWVDHLRSFCILLVVNMHACCTYSHVGGWYLTEGPDLPLSQKIPFYYWQGHLQAFFMGLLFFLAGHYALASLAAKGSAGFLKERLRRLLIPALLYMLVVHPFIVAGINPYGIPHEKLGSWLLSYYSELRFLSGSGPLWFVLALLCFCLGLVINHQLFPSLTRQRREPLTLQRGALAVVLLAVTLSLGTFLVRLWQPIGKDILNFQLCFFFQYVLVFVAGCLSWRDRWLETLASGRLAGRCLWFGLLGGPLLLTLVNIAFPIQSSPPPHFGGWNWPALGLATWEQSAGLCLGIGLLALFRRHANRPYPGSGWLNAQAFGVYVLHAPVLVALTLAFASLQASPLSKVLLLTVTGLLATLVVTAALRSLPGVKRIL